MTKDSRCTPGIVKRVAMAKIAFHKKKTTVKITQLLMQEHETFDYSNQVAYCTFYKVVSLFLSVHVSHLYVRHGHWEKEIGEDWKLLKCDAGWQWLV